MTRKEYEELHRVAKDKLGHQLHVGDLVVVVRTSNNIWTDYIYPDRLIKIKEDGISEN